MGSASLIWAVLGMRVGNPCKANGRCRNRKEICVYVCTCVGVCMCVFVYVCVCVFLCMCVCATSLKTCLKVVLSACSTYLAHLST